MYKVKLQSFEGPFDLLVYLIENAEMSIYDIKISEITTQYLDYIRQMEEQEVRVAQVKVPAGDHTFKISFKNAGKAPVTLNLDDLVLRMKEANR